MASSGSAAVIAISSTPWINKGAIINMPITLSILDRFAKLFTAAKSTKFTRKKHIRLLIYGRAKNIYRQYKHATFLVRFPTAGHFRHCNWLVEKGWTFWTPFVLWTQTEVAFVCLHSILHGALWHIVFLHLRNILTYLLTYLLTNSCKQFAFFSCVFGSSGFCAWCPIFSERDLTFTFAMSSSVRLSVVCRL